MPSPRYFFVLVWQDGREHDDPHGTVLPNDDTARAYAERVIRELQQSAGYDASGLTMVVRNDAGKTLFSIPFQKPAEGQTRLNGR
jgi:hypothetical protein